MYRFVPLLLLPFAASALAFDCTAPSAPPVPDANSASQQEMVDALQAVKAYQAANKTYRECLDEAHLQAHNSAVEEEKTLGEEMNAAIKTFKAREAEAEAQGADAS